MCDNHHIIMFNVVHVLTPGGPGCHGRVASIEGWGQETYVSCILACTLRCTCVLAIHTHVHVQVFIRLYYVLA